MTKKILAVTLLVCVSAAGWWLYRGRRASAPDAGSRLVTQAVERGSLESLVAGTGVVEAGTMIEVKSRASGQVVQFDFEEGDEVRRGQLLLQLDGTEEQRSLQVAAGELARVTADVARANAALQELRSTHELSLMAAEAKVAGAKALVDRARVALTLFKQEHPSTLASLQSAVAAARADVLAAANALKRVSALHKRKTVSDAELEAAGALHEQKQAALEKLKQEVSLARGAFELRIQLRTHEIAQLVAAQAGVTAERDKLKLTYEQALAMRTAELRAARARVTSAAVERDRAKDRVDQTRIYSELDGVLVAKLVEKGQIVASGISAVSGGTALARVADLDRLFVTADVDESDVGKVRRGQRARITVDAYPGTVFSGRVTAIAPQGVMENNVVIFKVKIIVFSLRRRMLSTFLRDRKPPAAGWARELGLDALQRKRAAAAFRAYAERVGAIVRARAEGEQRATRERRRKAFLEARGALERALKSTLDERQYAQYNERLLRVGMSAAVEIEVGGVKDALLIPAEALRRKGGQRGVYLATPGGPRFRPVGKVLLETGEAAALPLQGSGLKVGDRVVVRGLDERAGRSAGKQRGRSPFPRRLR